MRTQARTRQLRRGTLVALVLFASVALTSPLLHHDIACHLNSPGHCVGCTAAPAASRAEPAVAPPSHQAPRVEGVESGSERLRRPLFHARRSGRSPPA